jgi:hypothetical protein
MFAILARQQLNGRLCLPRLMLLKSDLMDAGAISLAPGKEPSRA